MIIKSGLITTGATNQVNSIFSNRSQEEIEAQQRIAAEKEAQRQKQLQSMLDGMNSGETNEKKWSIPFK